MQQGSQQTEKLKTASARQSSGSNDVGVGMEASGAGEIDSHALELARLDGQATAELALHGALDQVPARAISMGEVGPSLIDASLYEIGEEPSKNGRNGLIWNTGPVSYGVDLSYPQMRQIPANELGPLIVGRSLQWPVGSEGWKRQQESAQALQQPMFAPDDLIGAPIKLGVKGIAASAAAMFGTMKNIGSKEISVLLREGGGGLNKTVISFEDNLVLRGDASRAQIVQEIGNAAQPSIKSILELDPNARIGFRGSLADGLKNPTKLGTNGERVAFDGVVATKGGAPYIGPQGYDADFFVMSDGLAAQLGNKPFFRDAARLDSSLKSVFNDFGQTLRNNPILSGMKPEPPTFRVFTQNEILRKLNAGDAQIYFLTGRKR
jgi:hypothetical protein